MAYPCPVQQFSVQTDRLYIIDFGSRLNGFNIYFLAILHCQRHLRKSRRKQIVEILSGIGKETDRCKDVPCPHCSAIFILRITGSPGEVVFPDKIYIFGGLTGTVAVAEDKGRQESRFIVQFDQLFFESISKPVCHRLFPSAKTDQTTELMRSEQCVHPRITFVEIFHPRTVAQRRIDTDPFAVLFARTDKAIETMTFQIRIKQIHPLLGTVFQIVRRLIILHYPCNTCTAIVIVGILHSVAATHPCSRFRNPSLFQVKAVTGMKRIPFHQFIRLLAVESFQVFHESIGYDIVHVISALFHLPFQRAGKGRSTLSVVSETVYKRIHRFCHETLIDKHHQRILGAPCIPHAEMIVKMRLSARPTGIVARTIAGHHKTMIHGCIEQTLLFLGSPFYIDSGKHILPSRFRHTLHLVEATRTDLLFQIFTCILHTSE